MEQKSLNVLENILEDMFRALKNGAGYAALTLALTLPDVCAHLEYENPERTPRSYELYRNWFDKYITPRYDNLTGHDCYYLRCGVSHFASAEHSKLGTFKRIMFALPTGAMVDMNVILGDKHTLQVDLERFCNVMADAVRTWASNMPLDSYAARNIRTMLQHGSWRLPFLNVPIPVLSNMDD